MVIEANIDDMTPQNLAYVTERLLEAGALDVCTIPVQMKKGRSGSSAAGAVADESLRCSRPLIFQETTTHWLAAIRREAVGAGTGDGVGGNATTAA